MVTLPGEELLWIAGREGSNSDRWTADQLSPKAPRWFRHLRAVERLCAPILNSSMYTAMEEMYGDIPQFLWEAVQNEEIDHGDAIMQIQSQDVAALLKLGANDHRGKDSPLQESHFDQRGKRPYQI